MGRINDLQSITVNIVNSKYIKLYNIYGIMNKYGIINISLQYLQLFINLKSSIKNLNM